MSKIIIGIHGLGNKPPKELLEKWWLEAICEGLAGIDRFDFAPKFELVYWADILNDKPLNQLITDVENPYFLDEPYIPEPKDIEFKSHPTRKKILGFLEDQMDRLFLNEDLSSNFNFVSDIIFKKYFKELDIYYSEQPEINDPSFKSVKDIIRNRLGDLLKKHKGKEIFLISHSMGSIIAYDVCNFLVPKIDINIFVTMGSPLSIPIVIGKIAEELKTYNPNIAKLRTPKNVKGNWFNFSDIEDSVAMNYNLADDYEINSSGVKVQDNIINNNYVINNERNPHKSYGYLRAPEFSNILIDFLVRDCSSFKLWWLKTLYKIKGILEQFKKKVGF